MLLVNNIIELYMKSHRFINWDRIKYRSINNINVAHNLYGPSDVWRHIGYNFDEWWFHGKHIFPQKWYGNTEPVFICVLGGMFYSFVDYSTGTIL